MFALCRKYRNRTAILAGLSGAAAGHADIVVYLQPATQTVPLSAGSTSVQIVADIPAGEAVLGWGLDLDLTGASAAIVGAPLIGSAWHGVGALDGDGLAGAAATPDAVAGTGIVLATVALDLVALGDTTLTLRDDAPFDLTEGFALNPPPVGALASVTYLNDPANIVRVVPEPGALWLLLGAALLPGRRRIGR